MSRALFSIWGRSPGGSPGFVRVRRTGRAASKPERFMFVGYGGAIASDACLLTKFFNKMVIKGRCRRRIRYVSRQVTFSCV